MRIYDITKQTGTPENAPWVGPVTKNLSRATEKNMKKDPRWILGEVGSPIETSAPDVKYLAPRRYKTARPLVLEAVLCYESSYTELCT